MKITCWAGGTLGALAALAMSTPAAAQTPQPAPGEWQPPEGYMVIDDIVLPKDFFTDRATFGAGTRPWDHHVVYYTFDDNVSSLNRSRALAAIAEIESHCNLKFIESVDVNGYLEIGASTVNNSFVGKTGAYAQRVNIVSWSYKFIIVHELLHALGCWHEQQRPDRAAYVSINLDNIQSGAASNFAVISSASTFGPYDFESVMHYDACSFSVCCPPGSTCGCPSGCESITALPPYESFQSIMGQRSYLSDGDIDWLVYVYGDPDCNASGIDDYDDIQSGSSQDCNGNGVPDECDLASGVPTYSDAYYGFTDYTDCNGNDIPDSCDFVSGLSHDCNANNIPDECDIASGASQDVNADGEPDECTPAPGPFSLIAPTNGATSVATGPTLDWSDSTGVDTYLLEIATSPTFTNPAVSTALPVSDATLSPTALAPYTTYFWRVTSRNVGGSVVSSPSIAAFTTGAQTSFCAGDINADGTTNVYDFSVFATYFGQTGVTPHTNGDFDSDGDIDVFDFAVLATDFGCGS